MKPSAITRRAAGALCVLLVAMLAGTCDVDAVTIDDAGRVEILFRPGDAVDEHIIGVIRDARREIHVLAFTFTHRGIARALVDAHRRGVQVVVIADQAQALEVPHNALALLKSAGVRVALDGSMGSAHNKVMIIDAAGAHPVTITGSFNFTTAAQSRNAENVVIFAGNREVARRYEHYFQQRREAATEYVLP